jgi:hypothetical protein
VIPAAQGSVFLAKSGAALYQVRAFQGRFPNAKPLGPPQ